MRHLTTAFLALLILMTSATTAHAHEFVASSTGKVTLKLLQTTTFVTKAGAVECTGALLSSNQVTTTKATTLTGTTQFTGCKAFGLSAIVSPARITSTAEGSASLLTTVTVKAPGCIVTVPSAKNQNLHTVKYSNTNKEIEKRVNAIGITSHGEGAACEYALESQGTVAGDALVGLIGGTLEWK